MYIEGSLHLNWFQTANDYGSFSKTSFLCLFIKGILVFLHVIQTIRNQLLN